MKHQYEEKNERPILDWDILRVEIISMYNSSPDIIKEIGGDKTSLEETAKEVFVALIYDYAKSRFHGKPPFDLSYKLAEA